MTNGDQSQQDFKAGERWAKAQQLFLDAVELHDSDRSRFIAQSAGEDEALIAEVRKLLRGHTKAEGFIEPSEGRSARVDRAGSRIGQFTLVRQIGIGGMGTVYEAEQDEPRRRVALKLFRVLVATPAARRRFMEESALLARLKHPHVAQVFQAGVHHEMPGDAGTPYFTMELIEGARPITQAAASWTREAKLRLFINVCDAVHHGHQRGIIHRDLKPANVLVDFEGHPKVIDFGVARALDSDLTHATLSGALVGTVAYMSPEQAAGDRGAIDTRSDVYSLGVILFEMLCGKTPHDVQGKPVVQAARIIADEPGRRPSSLVPDVRDDLEAIILKALAKRRDDRYQSVGDLAQDLERFLSHQPVDAAASGTIYQLRKFARRHIGFVSVAGAMAAMVAAASLVSAYFMLEARTRAREVTALLEAESAARERSDRMTRFMQGALSSSNPWVPQTLRPELLNSDYDPWGEWRDSPWAYSGGAGGAASVDDVLMAAAARLDAEFADDPIAYAALAEPIALTLRRVKGEKEERRQATVERLLANALDRRMAVDPDAPETIRVMLRLAQAREEFTHAGNARGLYRRAAETCLRVYGPGDARTLRAESMLAQNLALSHPFEPAECLALFTTRLSGVISGGEPTAQEAEHLARAAWFAWSTGQPDKAKVWSRRAMDALLSLRGEDDPATVWAKEVAGRVMLADTATRAEGAALLARAAEVAERLFGPRNPITIDYISYSANGSLAVGKHAEALRRVARVLELASHSGMETWRREGTFVPVLAKVLRSESADPDMIGAVDAAMGVLTVTGDRTLEIRMYLEALRARAMARTGEAQAGLERLRVVEAAAKLPGDQTIYPQCWTLLHTARAECLAALNQKVEARSALEQAIQTVSMFGDRAEGEGWAKAAREMIAAMDKDAAGSNAGGTNGASTPR